MLTARIEFEWARFRSQIPDNTTVNVIEQLHVAFLAGAASVMDIVEELHDDVDGALRVTVTGEKNASR